MTVSIYCVSPCRKSTVTQLPFDHYFRTWDSNTVASWFPMSVKGRWIWNSGMRAWYNSSLSQVCALHKQSGTTFFVSNTLLLSCAVAGSVQHWRLKCHPCIASLGIFHAIPGHAWTHQHVELARSHEHTTLYCSLWIAAPHFPWHSVVSCYTVWWKCTMYLHLLI